jgi:hypothetical protein
MYGLAPRRSRWRFALASLVGHLVASYVFCAAALADLVQDPGEALAGLT